MGALIWDMYTEWSFELLQLWKDSSLKNAGYKNADFPNAPEVVLRPDVIYFGSNNFSATLEWSQYNDHETYSAAIAPEPLHTVRNTNIY